MWVFPLRKRKEGCDSILVKLLKRRPHLSDPIQRYIPVSPFIVSPPPTWSVAQVARLSDITPQHSLMIYLSTDDVNASIHFTQQIQQALIFTRVFEGRLKY